jgi:phytol kinase
MILSLTILALIFLGITGLCWSYGCLKFAAVLRERYRLRTGYTRKIFHLGIFLLVAVVHVYWGLLGVCLVGTMTSLIIAYALIRGEGHPLFEAISRPEDRPHRSYYVVVPYFATLAGGVMANVFFGPVALVGYLVAGLGDAAGEPVGTRWGKHRYAVRLYHSHASKSIEGSLAVLGGSLLALLIAVPQWRQNPELLLVLPLIAIGCMLIEALSPRGWDNTAMQLAPAFFVSILFH